MCMSGFWFMGWFIRIQQLNFFLCFSYSLLNSAVDFHARLRFPRADGEPPRRCAPVGQKSGGGSPRGDKHKTGQPQRRFLPFWMAWLMSRASSRRSWTGLTCLAFPAGVFVLHSNQQLEPVNNKNKL
jgi:hypothetical protein